MMSVVGFLGTVALAAGVIALWHVFWKVTSAGSATVAAEDAGTGHMEGEPERAPADERPVGVPIGRRAWSWIADRRALTVSLAVLVVACVAHRVVLGAWPWWEEHWMLSLIFLGEVVAVAAIAASASTHKGWRLTVSVLVTAVVLTFYGWITGLMPPVLWHALVDDALRLPVVKQWAGLWGQVHTWIRSVVRPAM